MLEKTIRCYLTLLTSKDMTLTESITPMKPTVVAGVLHGVQLIRAHLVLAVPILIVLTAIKKVKLFGG